MWKYEKEFREAHPETIGEKDGYFDLDNYKDFLEDKLEKLFAIPVVGGRSEQLKADVFKLANKLALEGYGFQVVKMHDIHNSLSLTITAT